MWAWVEFNIYRNCSNIFQPETSIHHSFIYFQNKQVEKVCWNNCKTEPVYVRLRYLLYFWCIVVLFGIYSNFFVNKIDQNSEFGRILKYLVCLWFSAQVNWKNRRNGEKCCRKTDSQTKTTNTRRFILQCVPKSSHQPCNFIMYLHFFAKTLQTKVLALIKH